MKNYMNLVKEIKETSLERDKKIYFDKILFRKITSTNLFELAIQNDIKALNQTVKFCQELGQSYDLPFCVSIVAQWIFINILNNFGTKEQKEKNLNKLMSAELIGGIANAEPNSGTSLTTMISGLSILDSEIINIEKSFYTNGPSDLIMCSIKNSENNNKFDILVLENENIKNLNLSNELIGFRTGATGSLTAQIDPNEVRHLLLGKSQEGSKIMRTCFNLERLLVSAVVSGTLQQIYKDMLHVAQRKNIFEHQHVQEKI